LLPKPTSGEGLGISSFGDSGTKLNSADIDAKKVAKFYHQTRKLIAELEQAIVSVEDDPTLIKLIDEEKLKTSYSGKRIFASSAASKILQSLEEIEKLKDVEISQVSIDVIKANKEHLRHL
jgi:hypothetical protein